MLAYVFLRERPIPGAARDAGPVLAANQVPHFRIRLYTGQYNKERILSVHVFGKSTRELSGGHTEENLFFWCDFTPENKEEKTNRHLSSNCRPFFAVCIREVSSKKPKDFFGVYRYFADADSEYWRGALKKSVVVGVLHVYFFHRSPNPAPWFAADGCILGIRRGGGERVSFSAPHVRMKLRSLPSPRLSP